MSCRKELDRNGIGLKVGGGTFVGERLTMKKKKKIKKKKKKTKTVQGIHAEKKWGKDSTLPTGIYDRGGRGKKSKVRETGRWLNWLVGIYLYRARG